MKTLALVALVALVFAALMTGTILGILARINEERRKTCGRCDFCDQPLAHCWMRGIAVKEDDEACKDFQERDKDIDNQLNEE